MTGNPRLPQGAPARQSLHLPYDRAAAPGSAIIGSSNFSLAGFAGNTGLNVRFDGREVDRLDAWFQNLRQNAANITELALTQLNRS